MIKIVKVNREQNNFTRYCGRSWAGLPESLFHNPYHVGKDGNRKQVLRKFAEYWYAPAQAGLRKKALEMISDDDILGCWCRPLNCHLDIIVGYVEWKRNERQVCLWE